ncbi:MAG: Crp/Fnr family transcriptional regulator [Anaerolineales bacterium]|nr:MAG: Crp/Fnr family transcriptional regulator [Anaerolineales bacterium]
MVMPQALKILETIQSAPLFNDVEPSVLESLARNSTIRKIAKGELLFYQDDLADAVYVVGSGCISIFLGMPDGRELVINVMRPGDVFGEIALFTDQSRSTGAMGREDTEVVSIPRQAFMDIVEGESDLLRRVLDMTAQRLRVSSERESALAFLDASARIARVLLVLEEQAVEKGMIEITQEDLSQHVGLTRQTVASTLGRWRRDGWVDTTRGAIKIQNRGVMEHFAYKTEV